MNHQLYSKMAKLQVVLSMIKLTCTFSHIDRRTSGVNFLIYIQFFSVPKKVQFLYCSSARCHNLRIFFFFNYQLSSYTNNVSFFTILNYYMNRFCDLYDSDTYVFDLYFLTMLISILI